MRQTLRLGRIAGIAVGVHWSVLGIMVLLMDGLAVVVLPGVADGLPWSVYWGAAVVGTLLFLVSLLAHEMSHAAVARHYGIGVERVTLWLLGGVAELSDEPPNARADLLVAAAGPVASFVAGVLFGAAGYAAAALGFPEIVTATLVWLTIVNIMLAVFNLLPGAPLDGGRVLRAILWRWRGNRDWAAAAAAQTGRALGLLLIAGGVVEAVFTGVFNGVWLALIGWFLVSAAGAERAAAQLHARLAQVPVRAVMSTNVVCGHARQSVDDFIEHVANERPHRTFPITDEAGHPAGVVQFEALTGVPADERQTVPLAQLATPIGDVPVIEPWQPVVDVTPALAGGTLALVVANTVLVGVVNSKDVSRAAHRLAPSSARSPTPDG